jgi:hypothetical protein
VLDDIGLCVRIEVQVHAEHISGSVVSTANGCEPDVALILAPGPIHDIVLPVNADIQTRDREVLEQALLTVADEGQTLAMKKVEFGVQRPRGDVRDFTDAPERGLVHQKLEDQPVLVRLLLSDSRRTHREGLCAGVAAVAFRARSGGAIAAIAGRAGRDADTVVGAVRVGAGCFRRCAQIGAETLVLLSDALVTLERRILTADVTLEHGELPTSTEDGIAVALRAAPSSLGRGDGVILTVGVLAEVDLDPAVLERDPRLRASGRFFLHGVIPLSSIR